MMARVNIPVDLEWADDLAEMTADRDHWKARAERAEAERAELRAERDAARAGQEWRPVTEPPTDNGDYLVWIKYPKEPGFHSVARWTQRFKWENNFVHPTYWQPLPAAPGDGGEEAG